jgi:Na+/H+ antiporter NhaD/arsenite permease-like protein
MHALIIGIFVVGYLLIAFEHSVGINKAATALLTAVLMWTVLATGGEAGVADGLREHLGEIAEVLFFLLGAMTIVELVDAHEGFRVITERIVTRDRRRLLWFVGLISFFLSAVLDNLTTAIVMVSLLRKLVDDAQERWLYAGIVVIAANAGGAWSPIGDVTTTMLWIGTQVSTLALVRELLLPSLACLLVPLLLLGARLEGELRSPAPSVPADDGADPVTPFERRLVFWLGLGVLLFVPVFKSVTQLPPYMGMLFGLGVLWVVTERLHGSKNEEIRRPLSIAGVLTRIDTTAVLFFLGILLAVACLASAGHLVVLGSQLERGLGNLYAVNLAIGLASAVIDNVPLVAGAMKMYPLIGPAELAAAGPEHAARAAQFVADGDFWILLAYCAGTGGSCLLIGSAAGVAVMSLEKMDFFWYLRHISLLALLGYLAGALVYIAGAAL